MGNTVTVNIKNPFFQKTQKNITVVLDIMCECF